MRDVQFSTLVKHPVDLHARAADRSRNGCRASALSVQGPDVLTVDPTFSARVDALSLRPLNAVALPLFDKSALHLRDHAQCTASDWGQSQVVSILAADTD
ncbi:pantothenate kinase-related protein Tda10 [Methylobacterium sp. R2-1]|nr:pantothenate kinase-related protein Tda10 [Methylobacterium sp. R2-1]